MCKQNAARASEAKRFAQITGLNPIPEDWDYTAERARFDEDLPKMILEAGRMSRLEAMEWRSMMRDMARGNKLRARRLSDVVEEP